MSLLDSALPEHLNLPALCPTPPLTPSTSESFFPPGASPTTSLDTHPTLHSIRTANQSNENEVINTPNPSPHASFVAGNSINKSELESDINNITTNTSPITTTPITGIPNPVNNNVSLHGSTPVPAHPPPLTINTKLLPSNNVLFSTDTDNISNVESTINNNNSNKTIASTGSISHISLNSPSLVTPESRLTDALNQAFSAISVSSLSPSVHSNHSSGFPDIVPNSANSIDSTIDAKGKRPESTSINFAEIGLGITGTDNENDIPALSSPPLPSPLPPPVSNTTSIAYPEPSLSELSASSSKLSEEDIKAFNSPKSGIDSAFQSHDSLPILTTGGKTSDLSMPGLSLAALSNEPSSANFINIGTVSPATSNASETNDGPMIEKKKILESNTLSTKLQSSLTAPVASVPLSVCIPNVTPISSLSLPLSSSSSPSLSVTSSPISNVKIDVSTNAETDNSINHIIASVIPPPYISTNTISVNNSNNANNSNISISAVNQSQSSIPDYPILPSSSQNKVSIESSFHQNISLDQTLTNPILISSESNPAPPESFVNKRRPSLKLTMPLNSVVSQDATSLIDSPVADLASLLIPHSSDTSDSIPIIDPLSNSLGSIKESSTTASILSPEILVNEPIHEMDPIALSASTSRSETSQSLVGFSLSDDKTNSNNATNALPILLPLPSPMLPEYATPLVTPNITQASFQSFPFPPLNSIPIENFSASPSAPFTSPSNVGINSSPPSINFDLKSPTELYYDKNATAAATNATVIAVGTTAPSSIPATALASTLSTTIATTVNSLALSSSPITDNALNLQEFGSNNLLSFSPPREKDSSKIITTTATISSSSSSSSYINNVTTISPRKSISIRPAVDPLLSTKISNTSLASSGSGNGDMTDLLVLQKTFSLPKLEVCFYFFLGGMLVFSFYCKR